MAATSLTIDTSSPIRRFSDSAVQAAVDKALTMVPEGRHVAVLAVADLKAAKLAVAVKINDHWSMMGVLEKTYKGPLEAQAALKASF